MLKHYPKRLTTFNGFYIGEQEMRTHTEAASSRHTRLKGAGMKLEGDHTQLAYSKTLNKRGEVLSFMCLLMFNSFY